MPVMVGTSGWQYADWRGGWYPEELAKSRWLEYYSGRFPTLEVNSAFYRLPERSTFESWHEQTPTGFVVAVKASRYLTHVRRLRDPEQAVARLVERLAGLGTKLGPVLLQLPPTLRCDTAALDATLSAFPPKIKVAVEPRHESWFVDDVADLLVRHDSALCLADPPPVPAKVHDWKRTASWGYLRFHKGVATPSPCYGSQALRSWARRVAALYEPEAPVFAYFNGCGSLEVTSL